MISITGYIKQIFVTLELTAIATVSGHKVITVVQCVLYPLKRVIHLYPTFRCSKYSIDYQSQARTTDVF